MCDRAERVAELVEAALDLEADERIAFLDRECGDHPDLHAEVESLLGFQRQAEAFIEEPAYHLAAESFAQEQGELLPDDQLGHYRIKSLLGEGGMGEVYLADDLQFGRAVAIKLIKRAFGRASFRRQFEQEERILAALNHPNIARLYGGEVTADGLPYFVMEYVEGERLDEYCARGQLTIAARLEIFRKICAAVSYAHQNLVIHRDLKPANIRVNAEGEPKLLDFGIAKLLDQAAEDAPEQTISLASVMTPDYASPEQVRGERMTTASDVYSLGVILYQLLTGTKPLRLTSRRPEAISRAVTEQQPSRPSENRESKIANRKSLRGDLDNIVLMAMRKEPERRYVSVAQFSEDIRRHLAGLPVVARQPTWRYRSRKFLGRHRAVAAAAALLLLTLLAGITATTMQARRAERQRALAEHRFSEVRDLSNALLFEIAPKIERLEGATEARQAVLTQSLKYLDRLAGEAHEDRALQSELAAAYEKIGNLEGNPTNPNLVALSDSLDSYGKANAIRRRLLQSDPANPEQRRLLADNYRALGDIHFQTNEPAKSLQASEDALRIYGDLLGAQPTSVPLRLAQGQTLHDIGICFSTNGKKAEAMPYFRRVIEAAEKLQQETPGDPATLALLANGHRQLGNALSWELKQEAAETEMAEAVAIYEKLTAAHPADLGLRTGLYQTFMMTSNVYEEVNNPLAHEYAEKALGIIEPMVEKDPANLRARQQLAKTWSRLGATWVNIGQPAESVASLEKAVAGLEAITQLESRNRRFLQDLALAWMRLGDARRLQLNLIDAREMLEKSAALFSRLAEGDAADNTARRNLANASASLAQVHDDSAALPAGGQAQTHRLLAQQNRERAIATFRELEARNALSKFDRKSLEEMEQAKRAAALP